jgi:hypothetical protein
MKNTKTLLLHGLLALLLAGGFAACVKTEFDEPPVETTPVDITANTTIAELRLMRESTSGIDTVRAGAVIEGEVIMDDRSGNYYKTLVVQDATGGIEIKFNDGYLFQNYPIGRKVYIRAGGLLLTDYNGTIQLIGSVVDEGGQPREIGLTEAQVRTRIVKGPIADVPLQPRQLTIGELAPEHLSTLIELVDVQFIKADTVETWAEPVAQVSVNRTLEDCAGDRVLVRTSGFADFAAALTPRGRGNLVGVLGVYNSSGAIQPEDYQVYFRNLNDIKMDSLRCGEVVVVIPPTGLTSLMEDFSGESSPDAVGPGGWYNIAVTGTELWEARSFSGNLFAQATAFSGPATMESWLITPGLDLRTAKTLAFRSSWGFYKHQGLTVWYSTDFNGTNPTAATWTQLNPTLPNASTPLDNGSTSYSQWIPSGDVALPVVASGKVYIGFKYVGDNANNTTTWRVDDVKVQ